MKHQSVFDTFATAFGQAVADVREKLVDEAFFGRVLQERDHPQAHTLPAWPQAREVQSEAGEHERDNAADMDMDR